MEKDKRVEVEVEVEEGSRQKERGVTQILYLKKEKIER